MLDWLCVHGRWSRYDALMDTYRVKLALIVGPPESSYPGNNDFVAGLASEFDWLRPVAALRVPELTVDRLEALADPFIGVALYTASKMDDGRLESAALQEVPSNVWEWLVRRRWLVSVNDVCLSRSPDSGWAAWLNVLEDYPELRLLVSHLGLPEAAPDAPPGTAHWTVEQCRERIADVLAFAAYPGPRVKLSGFYALTSPSHDYPHETAWGYVEALLEEYTASRLLWASDYPPALTGGDLSFPQTIDLFAKMPFLTDEERQKIEGGNLLALVKEAKESETSGDSTAKL